MADQNIYIDADAASGGDGITTPYDSFADINWTTGGANSIFDWVAAGDDVFINLARSATFTTRLQIAASGALGHRITVQPYGIGDLPIINVPSDVYAGLSAADGYDHLRVTGISFEGTPRYFSVNFLGCDDVVVDNCVFTDGKSLKWKGDTASIYNNTFIRNRDGAANSAIDIVAGSNTNPTDTLKVYNNAFIDCYTTGDAEADGHLIGLAGGIASSRTIAHVEIYNNIATGCGSKSGKGAISLFNVEDVQIYNNRISDGFQGGITVGTNCKDIDVLGNVIVNNSLSATTARAGGILISQATGGPAASTVIENVNVIGNTIANNDDTNNPTAHRDGISLYVANVAGYTLNNIVVKNNICENNFTSVTASPYSFEFRKFNLSATPTITNLDIDYNNFYRTANTDYFILWGDSSDVYSVAEWGDYQTDSSQDANSITSDPLLFASGKLKIDSPCMDAGSQIAGINDNGELDIWGNATDGTPNTGAYQGEGAGKFARVIGGVRL